jgi:hypothetical protein
MRSPSVVSAFRASSDGDLAGVTSLVTAMARPVRWLPLGQVLHVVLLGAVRLRRNVRRREAVGAGTVAQFPNGGRQASAAGLPRVPGVNAVDDLAACVVRTRRGDDALDVEV